MKYLSFTDFKVPADFVLSEIAALPSRFVYQQCRNAYERLCKEAFVFLDDVDVSAKSNQPVELLSPYPDYIIVGIYHVSRDGQDVHSEEYSRNDGRDICFVHDGEYRVSCVFEPKQDAMTAPVEIIDRYGSVITMGAKASILKIQDTPWYKPQLAGHYERLFNRAILDALADVRNNYSVTRQGPTAVYRPSYYY